MRTLLADRYEFQRNIGSGSFGVVRLYRDTLGPASSVVAIKSIPYSKIVQEGHRLVREIEIMLFLRDQHPHIINCFYAFATLDSRGTRLVSEEDIPNLPESEQVTRTVACLKQWVEEAAIVKAKIEAVTANNQRLRVDTNSNPAEAFTIHLVLPFMNGDLDRFISNFKRNNLGAITGPNGLVGSNYMETTVAVVAFQVLFGMDFLHKSHIVHRDLKPENILLRLDTNNAYCTSAIVADFGLACLETETGTFYVCTRTYRPPELIVARTTAHSSIDVWSLGCILYELVTGRRLIDIPSSRDQQGEWSGSQAAGQLELVMNIVGTPSHADVLEYLVDDADPVKSYLLKTAARTSQVRALLLANLCIPIGSDEVKELWIDLITSCLRFFPEQRPTAEELCRHRLFAAYGMVYGSNVNQYAATPYKACVTVSSRPEKNVMTALAQITEHLTREITEGTITSPPMLPISSPTLIPQEAVAMMDAGGAKGAQRRVVSFPFLRTEDLMDKYGAMPLHSMEDVLDATDSCEFDLHVLKEELKEHPEDQQLKIRMEDLRNLLNYLSQLVNWEPVGEDDEEGGGDEDEDQ